MDTALLRNLKDKVKNFITKKNNICIGIYIDSNAIFCTQVIKENTGVLKISYADKINIAGNSDEDKQYAVEEVQNSFLKAGISVENVIVCLGEDDVYYYHKEFPAVEKISSAIHWDIAGNVPFGEDYMESFYQEDKESNRYLLGAVEKDYLREVQDLFTASDINIISFVTNTEKNIVRKQEYIMAGDVRCIMPEFLADYFVDEGQLSALYASVSGFYSQGLEFSLKNKYPAWNYLHLTACVLLISFIVAGSALCFSFYQYYNVKHDLAEAKQEFLLLSEVWESKRCSDEMNDKYKAKASLLQDLTRSSWPVYAIMVHLGCNTEEGTWLTDMSADGDKDILLKGESVSYNSLVKYYQMLAEDKDFFTGGAVLEKSDLSADGNIAFSIKLRL